MKKKVLLVGELNEIARSLNEGLVEDFNVQLCSVNLENVQAMAKIFKPDLILLCQIGNEESDSDVYTWVCENSRKISGLIITTDDRWTTDTAFEENERLAVMFRPVTKEKLLKKCYRLLSINDASKQTERKEKDIRPKKIMIVDDCALLLRNMKVLMEKYYEVSLAKSGEQALELIPKVRPDLILLDYEMEGMDGKTTLEEMKKDEQMRDIPVIFLTSIADQSTILSVLKAKPDGYILKPPDEKRIRETIEKIFLERAL